jgi:hypothetical protein
MRNYNKVVSPDGREVIWYEENGVRYSFGTDPSNSDYQEYLEYLEDNK